MTRLFLLLVLSALVVTVLKQGLCTFNPDLCQSGDIDYSYRKPMSDFEVEKREVRLLGLWCSLFGIVL